MTAADGVASSTSPQPPSPPPLPDGWTRCHYFLERKNRYCRQQLAQGSQYCGNHLTQCSSQRTARDAGIYLHRKRIPCPIDASHTIYEDQVKKHAKVCPFVKKQRLQQQQPYFRLNVNTGGHGSTTATVYTNASENILHKSIAAQPNDATWARALAVKILKAHQATFAVPGVNDDDVRNLSLQDIVDSIPTMDLSHAELQEGRLRQSVDHYRIKSGGERHLHQQASLLGHLRRLGVFHPDATSSTSGTMTTTTNTKLTLVEMGAGRGMFGLMAAGVAAKCQRIDPRLILVERAGGRGRADGVLRMAGDGTDYMELNRVQFRRVSCDLAHVHLPTVLVDDHDEKQQHHEQRSQSAGSKRKHCNHLEKTVVIAKHLCGAGTDLALKSLQEMKVDACVMATCCHGVCAWEHYVGRDFLKATLGEDFGPAEFTLMCRWSSGTVTSGPGRAAAAADEHGKDDEASQDSDEHGGARCDCPTTDDDGSGSTDVRSIVQSLKLSSIGHEGLGRACQRLLDKGRLEYMRNVVFKGNCQEVEMFHYVPSSVTPQNAVLVAHRK